MLEKSDIPEIRDAVNLVRYFSADEQMKINAFEREMAIRDRMAEIAAAKRDGRAEAEEEIKKARDEVARAEERATRAEEKAMRSEENEMQAEERAMQAEEKTARTEQSAIESAVRALKALMTKQKLTAEEAMDILETPSDKREIYRKMLISEKTVEQ